MTAAQLRPHVGRLTALLAAPAVFWGALIALTPVAFVLSAGLGSLGDSAVAGVLAIVLMVAAAAAWKARQMGETLRVPAPAVVIPTMLALGSMVMAGVPFVLNGQYGAEWLAVPATTACWWSAATLLAVGGVRLVRQGRATTAKALMVVGTLAVLLLSGTVYLGVLAASRAEIFAWGDFGGHLSLGSLPALLTVSTPFLFTLLEAGARRQPTR